MMYFLGFTLGNLFIPKLMDSYGRKKIFVSCMYVQLATLFAMLTIPPHNKHGQ
jgi:MFS family permease